MLNRLVMVSKEVFLNGVLVKSETYNIHPDISEHLLILMENQKDTTVYSLNRTTSTLELTTS